MKQYTLAKTYPGSPKLNTKVYLELENSYTTNLQNDFRLFSKDQVENYPEFWELVVEKDYEILSLIFNKHGNLIKKYTILTKNNSNFEYILQNGCWNIHSVKRLSDSEIFTISDEVFIPEDHETRQVIFSIKKFEISNHKLLVHQTDSQTHCIPYITTIQKFKQSLFKTKDGIDIFKGDEIWSVNETSFNLTIDSPVLIDSSNVDKLSKKNIKFSTKEKAEEYIILNKPCLSHKDVYDLLGRLSTASLRQSDYYSLNDKLKQIIKNKLKIK